MGLVRLKNSFRIVNHPPAQPERAAPVRQAPPGTQKGR